MYIHAERRPLFALLRLFPRQAATNRRDASPLLALLFLRGGGKGGLAWTCICLERGLESAASGCAQEAETPGQRGEAAASAARSSPFRSCCGRETRLLGQGRQTAASQRRRNCRRAYAALYVMCRAACSGLGGLPEWPAGCLAGALCCSLAGAERAVPVVVSRPLLCAAAGCGLHASSAPSSSLNGSLTRHREANCPGKPACTREVPPSSLLSRDAGFLGRDTSPPRCDMAVRSLLFSCFARPALTGPELLAPSVCLARARGRPQTGGRRGQPTHAGHKGLWPAVSPGCLVRQSTETDTGSAAAGPASPIGAWRQAGLTGKVLEPVPCSPPGGVASWASSDACSSSQPASEQRSALLLVPGYLSVACTP